MFTIRKAQLDALARLQRKPLETDVRGHLVQRFPQDCARFSVQELKDFVTEVFDRAQTYGFVSPRALSKYADLAMVYGRAFDVDPKHAWAADILKSKDITDADTRIDVLCREGLHRLAQRG